LGKTFTKVRRTSKPHRRDFQDPGDRSALRRATRNNPRNLPCPTCGTSNQLTQQDVRLQYQCDNCADIEERGW
jgi:predicted RNA-binding Zn-ribbon protein involved in translation (DUF1610 family)